MKKCVLLSMDSLENFECYDTLTIEPLKNLGWHAEKISWRNTQVDWNNYDAVIIRSTWDYQDNSQAFLRTLEMIDQSKAVLANRLDTVKWNIDKKYLRDLEDGGTTIVPSIWGNNYSPEKLEEAFRSFNCEELIIKPCVSANADDTFRLKKDDTTIDHQNLTLVFKDRDFIIQPFMSSVVSEGEYSLFYFNGVYSHTILKKPKTNDFRVQEEHGGQLTKVEPEKLLIDTANKTLELLHNTLYARLDFVRLGNQFALMEAELIEPSLYFNMDNKAPARFAKAFADYMENI